jgi:NAD(P)-dependent dehydrogenase (short-subunit alcohol dehydrogenase family)
MDEQGGITRRKMISGLGAAGIGALGASNVSAAQERHETMTTQKLEHPKNKYAKPPFKEQSQPWPGLASKMEPRPDHGEKSYKGSGRLLGRKTPITGGDSGMGRAAAIAYAREGADVAINYFPTEQLDADEVVALIRESGRKAVAIPGDLRDENFCEELVADAVEQLGGLDILLCNAARQQTRPSILDISSQDFDATMKTNVYAPFWIIKAAVAHMPPGAVIIATTSEQATDLSAEIYDYAQTKAATTNYVRSLAKQLATKGIRVNGVAPGPIWTPLQVSGGATMEELKEFGGANTARPSRSISRACLDLRSARRERCELRNRSGFTAPLEVQASRSESDQ